MAGEAEWYYSSDEESVEIEWEEEEKKELSSILQRSVNEVVWRNQKFYSSDVALTNDSKEIQMVVNFRTKKENNGPYASEEIKKRETKFFRQHFVSHLNMFRRNRIAKVKDKFLSEYLHAPCWCTSVHSRFVVLRSPLHCSFWCRALRGQES